MVTIDSSICQLLQNYVLYYCNSTKFAYSICNTYINMIDLQVFLEFIICRYYFCCLAPLFTISIVLRIKSRWL